MSTQYRVYKTKKKLRAMFPSCGWTQTRAPSRNPHRHPPSHGTYALAAASLLPFLQYLWLRRNLGSMPLVDLFACFLGFLMPEQGDGKDQRSEEGLNCTEAGVRKP